MPFKTRDFGNFPGERAHYQHRTDDDIVDVLKTGYFQVSTLKRGDRIEVSAKGGAEATLAVIDPAKDGKVKTWPLACYDPLDSLDRIPMKKRPEKKMAPEEEPVPADA